MNLQQAKKRQKATREIIDFFSEENEFKRYASVFGLKAKDYKREFKSDGLNFELTGFDLSSKKYPIIGTRYNQKFRFSLDVIKGQQ